MMQAWSLHDLNRMDKIRGSWCMMQFHSHHCEDTTACPQGVMHAAAEHAPAAAPTAAAPSRQSAVSPARQNAAAP